MELSEYAGEFFLECEIGRPTPANSRFAVVPFPFEGSVSYAPGTAKGPAAILEASQQLELYDGISTPGEAGIFTNAALDCSPRRFSSTQGPTDDEVAELFDEAASLVSAVLKTDTIPVILGGEHSISYGPVRAVQAHYGHNVGIVQIDAHADLRLAYEGRVWSHASVMRRLADEGVPILQLGVRALCVEEAQYRDSHDHIHYYDARELVTGNITEIELPDTFPPFVYLTLDADGLDPSIMPATGTPVPGGLGWYQTLSLIESIVRQRQVVAMDMVELAPLQGLHASDFLCAQLVYSTMGIIQRGSTSS